MYFLDGFSTDPCFNLAMEEYLFNKAGAEEYFMLWQNDNAIIIGRHQNTLEEINEDYVNKQGIKVVRRITGGGAVYHDLGNLNYSFISPLESAADFDFRFFTRPILEIMSFLGIEAEFSSRNDLTISGMKFSGTAQHISRKKLLHHGTLLFSADLNILGRALKANKTKLAAKGISSVRSRVTNIREHLKEALSIEEFRKIVKEYLFRSDNMQEIALTQEDITAINQLKAGRYETWEWNYGKSPDYNCRRELQFQAGILSALMFIENGCIKNVRFYGDFFSRGDIGELEDLLQGVSLERLSILDALTGIDLDAFINGINPGQLAEALAG